MKTIKTLIFIAIMTVSLTSFTSQNIDGKQKTEDGIKQLDKAVIIYAKNGFIDDSNGPN